MRICVEDIIVKMRFSVIKFKLLYKAINERAASWSEAALSGDAGNRTPVRRENHQNIYVNSLLLVVLVPSTRSKRGTCTLPRNLFATEFRGDPEAILTKSTPFCNPPGGVTEDGLLVIKQPVRSCSWHLLFFRFINVQLGEHETQFRPFSSPSKPCHPHE